MKIYGTLIKAAIVNISSLQLYVSEAVMIILERDGSSGNSLIYSP
jgi:hypothetical protein